MFFAADSLFEKQKLCQSNLRKKNQGNANGKFDVPGFVAYRIHSDQGADAAAQKSRGDERRFRDAPEIFPGFVFVNQHKTEGNCIDYQQVDGEKFFHEFETFQEGYV